MWLFAWFGYWIEIAIVLVVRLWRGELTDAKKKYDRRLAQDAESLNGHPLKGSANVSDSGSEQDPKLKQEQIGDKQCLAGLHDEAVPEHKSTGQLEMSRSKV